MSMSESNVELHECCNPRGDGIGVYRYAGWRVVVPYFCEMKSICKGRWVGRSLVEVFAQEFADGSPAAVERLQQEVACGTVRVNGLAASTGDVLQAGDRICRLLHVHEKPCWMSDKVRVLSETPDLYAVHKPGGIPVHACGKYRKNTLIEGIWTEEMGMPPVYPINRLDRLTSGVMLLPKTPTVAQRLRQEFDRRAIKKLYLARVAGRLPAEDSGAPAGDGAARTVLAQQPLVLISAKHGIMGCLCEPAPEEQQAVTEFVEVAYDPASDESVVSCRPTTGRMHQIRVHLQWIGCPVVGDPDYGAFLSSEDRQLSLSAKCNAAAEAKKHRHVARSQNLMYISPCHERILRGLDLEDGHAPNCDECVRPLPLSIAGSQPMCLHAWKYELADGNEFESPPPSWCFGI